MARCRTCGFENPAGFRFCGACGRQLELAEVAPGEERKVVSALFCDLAEFTQRAERLDPEDVHRVLSPYYAALRADLERFGGTVEKFIGDAVFALFGAPRAHEDDPERAVRAALAICAAIADLNEGDPELDLHLRIGVTTGEAVVHLHARPIEGEGMAWGDVLNTAARLQAAAPVDGILVDEATFRATRNAIDYGVAEPVKAKGKAEPVLVWQALSPIARRGADLAVTGREPLVGRRDELALLVESLYRCQRRRASELATIVGEPGVGKSRLVLELFRRLEMGTALITWRQGRSSPYGDGFTFLALGEIVKGQAGILDTDNAATAADKLGRAVRDLVPAAADAARIEGHLRSLVGLGTEEMAHRDQRSAAFAAWRHFLEALARQRPLVVVFEDIQWADDGLLDFLEYLLDWTRDASILVICTARPELLDRRRGWGQKKNAATLSLAPLSEEETAELVSMLVEDTVLPAETEQSIVAGASGNPLYAVEFVRMLADRGALSPLSAKTGPTSIEALPVPASLQGIIAARIDSLSAEEKALLQDAAVVGRVVWPGALALIDGRSPRWAERRLRSLERKEFLARSRPSSVEGEHEYRFRHILVRDVAYGQIPRGRRGEIHKLTAEWLESLSPDRTADRAEMLAHHYVTALELARTTGRGIDGLADRARLALREAGDKALALHAFPTALRFYRAALELWPEADAGRPRLLFDLGRMCYYAETAGADVLAEARDLLLAADERGRAAEAEALLGQMAWHSGERRRTFEHMERAVAFVADLKPTRSKAEVLVDLAGLLAVANENERAVEIAREALGIAAGLELRELEAHALGIVGTARWFMGDLDGQVDLERSIVIAEEVSSPQSAYSYGSLAELMGTLGDLSRAFELQARAREHAERFGHGGNLRWFMAERVGEGYWRGSWDDALTLADEFIAEAESGSPHFMEAYCRDMRGRMRLARGDEAGARDDAAKALDFARAAEDLQMLYPALAFHAYSLLVTGSTEESASVATELLDLWASKRGALPASAWVTELAYVLGPLGRGAALEEAAALVPIRTRWLDAAVAFATGDFHGAAALYNVIGSLPDEALSHLRAAETLFADGLAAEADAEVALAGSFFRQVRASAYLHEGERYTSDLGAIVTPPTKT